MRSGDQTLAQGPLSLTVDKVGLERLQAISFSVGAGERLDLSGAAAEGAEKLFSIIQGRERRPDGEIRIGGASLKEISPSSLRRRVGRVTTAPLILRGSLRRTLTLGCRRRPTDRRIRAMMEMVGLNEELRDLDQSLLAGGPELTPGERARLALANALLNKSGLLLIDAAATAHLIDLEEVLKRCGLKETTLITVRLAS